MNQPPKIHVIISFIDAYHYLIRRLEMVDSDPDFAASILSLLADSTLNLDADWGETNVFEAAHEALAHCPGFTEEQASEICRQTDWMIANTIQTHIPDFGSPHFRGNVKYEFIDNHTVRITIEPRLLPPEAPAR